MIRRDLIDLELRAFTRRGWLDLTDDEGAAATARIDYQPRASANRCKVSLTITAAGCDLRHYSGGAESPRDARDLAAILLDAADLMQDPRATLSSLCGEMEPEPPENITRLNRLIDAGYSASEAQEIENIQAGRDRHHGEG